MTRHRPFLVALTGGIASGKTAVSDAFARLGADIIDTDLIAREVVALGTPLLQSIRDTFGPGVIDAKGGLDRRALRERVFADAGERQRLEQLLHPEIRLEALRRIDSSQAEICILVIPLLAESGGFPGLDRVLLVEADQETRVHRVMERDGVDRAAALAVLAAQAGDAERRALADDVIDNSGSLEDLQQRVAALWAEYLELAGTQGGH